MIVLLYSFTVDVPGDEVMSESTEPEGYFDNYKFEVNGAYV